ncbi:MAG: relaxase/mobilization nuclease domain-containing protein [Halarcobacter sp.]
MIIKSMSRKSKSFSQLYDYLMREEQSFCFTRNAYSNPKNKKELIKEFMQNSYYLKNARGKNYLYHELLSLEQNNLSIKRQKEILLDLADKFLKLRASNHIAFGVVHEDKQHIHLHLMLSANEIEGQKRVRLSKQELASIQATLEHYKNGKYLELSQSEFYQKRKDLSKMYQKEQEMKHRRNKQPKKEMIKEELEKIFKTATSRKYLENYLKNRGFTLDKSRGQTIKIIYENKPYRLKTLGLEKEYKELEKRLEQIQEREMKRQRAKEERIQTRKNQEQTFER